MMAILNQAESSDKDLSWFCRNKLWQTLLEKRESNAMKGCKCEQEKYTEDDKCLGIRPGSTEWITNQCWKLKPSVDFFHLPYIY